MSFLDEFNALLEIAEKAAGGLKLHAERWDEKSAQWLERTKIEAASKDQIKTENFSSEMEKSIMLKAAEDERQRKSVLVKELEDDPILAKFYYDALVKIKGDLDSDSKSLLSLRSAEKAAMKLAIHMLEQEAELTRRGPEYRKRFEEALAIISKARLKD